MSVNAIAQNTPEEIDEAPWPDLPPITDQGLHRLVFTHRSLSTTGYFDGKRISSEILAHIGDAVLQFFITCLLRGLFPDANVDEVTQTRSKLVDVKMNYTFTEHYDLAKNVRASRGLGSLDLSTREKGELWEAYLGALFYSNIKELDTRIAALPDLQSLSIKSEDNASVTQNTISRIPFHSQAFDKLSPFLEALYIPFALHLIDPDKEERKKLLEIALSSRSKADLQEHLQKGEISDLIYNIDLPGNKPQKFLPDGIEENGFQGMLYRATCRVVTNDGKVWKSEGIAENIKNAETLAAHSALTQAKASGLGGGKVFRKNRR